MRIEPPSSVPIARGARRPATAAPEPPEPPEEPPVDRYVSYGFRQGPNASGSVVMPALNSGVLVLPRISMHLSMPPSEYWRRQCFATFQVDRYGIENRHKVTVETIMWTSDYPHAGSDWPYARERIDTRLHDVPEDERRLILSGNAMRYYGLDAAELSTGFVQQSG